jgi:MFS family permease
VRCRSSASSEAHSVGREGTRARPDVGRQSTQDFPINTRFPLQSSGLLTTQESLPERASPLVPRVRRRALTISVADGLLHAVMLGVTENYLSALAVELGHGARHQALLTSVPVLAGALSQLCAPFFTRLCGSRKRFVVACAALQALTHLWFISIAHSQDRALLPFLTAKVLYFVGGNMLTPAWSSWMASLTTPGPSRERYFALRSGAIQAVLLLAFAGGAFGLRGAARETLLQVYGQLFWVGLGARALSACLLSAQHDPERGVSLQRRLRLGEAFERADFRVALYLTALYFGTYIASPFFVPWWLHELKLGYHQYAVLMGTSMLARTLTVPSLHRVARRWGMLKLLYVAGLGATFLPVAWASAHSFQTFVLIQVLSGVIWGAIEYASFQLLLQDSPEETRLEFLSIAGTMGGLGQLFGSLVGGTLLDQVHLPYPTVFAISSVVRAIPLILAFVLPHVGRVGRSLIEKARTRA